MYPTVYIIDPVFGGCGGGVGGSAVVMAGVRRGSGSAANFKAINWASTGGEPPRRL